ncbi:MAG: hypothetical protein GY765_30110 [bacterium]|nr:hypothetical protein [bacterium]
MRIKLILLIIILLLLSGLLQYRYDSRIDYVADKNVFVTLPPGKSLRVLSFGYHHLVADMLFLWSIQFYSTYNLSNRYDYLEQVFNTITDLTPNYREVYLVGSWIMALELGDIEMGIRLLQKGSASMPNEWIFDYECGFYAYKNLKDYQRAAEYYKEAASRPTAPAMIRRREAHMIYLKDNLTEAYKMWLEIYKTADTRMAKDSAFNHLYQIKSEWDSQKLKTKLEEFKTKYGRYPDSLDALVKAGILKDESVLKDFMGTPYKYQPRSGEITSRKVFKWKK